MISLVVISTLFTNISLLQYTLTVMISYVILNLHNNYTTKIKIMQDREKMLIESIKKLNEENQLNMDDMDENDIGYISKNIELYDDITIDNILDKINKDGIQSLTDEEKKILEKFSK